jgi:Mrp family chromosome partitioning ATPase
MKEFVNAVRERYDRVLFDSPPALAVTDAAVIGAIVDGTLMVLQAGKAKYEMALECRERMQASGSHVIGGILNNVTARLARYHYSYYYRYGYYKQT